jgi:hypothetical protein
MQLREATSHDITLVQAITTSGSIGQDVPLLIDLCWALEHDSTLLMVGGFKLIAPGVAWCWMSWTPAVREHVYHAYRVVLEWTDLAMRAHGIRRLMAAVDPDYPEAVRTITHLGFHRESIMEHWFGVDQSAHMYVKLGVH